MFRGRQGRAEQREWSLHNLAMVSMDHALKRLPSEISGGMKQRAGIALALAVDLPRPRDRLAMADDG